MHLNELIMTRTEKIGWRITALAVITLLLAALCSCARRTAAVVERASVRTDTLYQVKHSTDTIIYRDTVNTLVSGDTVLREVIRWRLRYRDRTDTLYKARTDSVRIPVPYEVVKTKYVPKEVVREVERKPPWWDTLLRRIGLLCVICFAVTVVWVLFKLRKR